MVKCNVFKSNLKGREGGIFGIGAAGTRRLILNGKAWSGVSLHFGGGRGGGGGGGGRSLLPSCRLAKRQAASVALTGGHKR